MKHDCVKQNVLLRNFTCRAADHASVLQERIFSLLRRADGDHEGRPEHGEDGAVQQAVENDDPEREGHVPEAMRTGSL